MCKNATQTAASVMAAIEPTLESLLSYAGVLDTKEAQAAIAAYKVALTAVQNWKSGTTAQNVLTLVGDFQIAFNAVATLLPPTVATLVNIILAGVETVIGILTANSPNPVAAPADASASADESKASYQAHVIHETTVKVQDLVPSFKRSFFHSAESQYKSAWNRAVETGGFPNSMRV
jgi:hypothetical protein